MVAVSGAGNAKMYKPHDDPTVFVGNDNVGSELLSADEKIRELSGLVEILKAERQKASKDLEEVQAEKVSMEYLLREKLEKLVQTEIETRLHKYRRNDREGAVLERPLAKLNADLEKSRGELKRALDERNTAAEEVRQLRRKLEQLAASKKLKESVDAPSPRALDRANQLQTRVAALTKDHQRFRDDMGKRMFEKDQAMEQLHKERRAIQTIMERKIKTLVDNIRPSRRQ